MPDPDLAPKIPEPSDTCEMNEIYSVYLRFYDTINSVWDNEIIEWEWFDFIAIRRIVILQGIVL